MGATRQRSSMTAPPLRDLRPPNGLDAYMPTLYISIIYHQKNVWECLSSILFCDVYKPVECRRFGCARQNESASHRENPVCYPRRRVMVLRGLTTDIYIYNIFIIYIYYKYTPIRQLWSVFWGKPTETANVRFIQIGYRLQKLRLQLQVKGAALYDTDAKQN